MKQLLLIVVDIQHPFLHFPPAIYNHVVNVPLEKLVVGISNYSQTKEEAPRDTIKGTLISNFYPFFTLKLP